MVIQTKQGLQKSTYALGVLDSARKRQLLITIEDVKKLLFMGLIGVSFLVRLVYVALLTSNVLLPFFTKCDDRMGL